jgi:hypothetical protein
MCQKGLACYKKINYVESIRTCILQEVTLYEINKDLSLTRRHFIWGHKGLVCYKILNYKMSIITSLLQEVTLCVVNKKLSVTRRHVL